MLSRLRRMLLFVLSAAPIAAETHHVRTSAELLALPTLNAGDRVIVHDGQYENIDKDITGEGTAEQPVLIEAETPGGVAFKGETYVGIHGTHVSFSGFRFDGDTAEGGPKRKHGPLRLAKGSRSCRVAHCMFRKFDKSPLTDTQWLVVEGFEHLIEHNSFEGKTSGGPTVVFTMTEGPESKETPRRHVFRRNYLGPRTSVGGNGYEGVRVGLSGLQEFNAASTFEYNYFFRTIYFPEGQSGEQEVVSNKSSGNTYRYNTFHEMKGELSLRHGDDCVVEGNYFLQGGTERSGGVRVIGERHVVRNNYFDGVAGIGVLVYSGDRDWPADEVSRGHEAGDDAKVLNNTFVNCKAAIAVGGSTAKRRAPERVEVRNNLIQAQGADAVGLRLDAPVTVSGNQVFHPEAGAPDVPGVTRASFALLVGEADGALFRRAKGIEAGAEQPSEIGGTRVPVRRGDVGPSYYTEP